jgi:hypothetical protein
MQNKNTRYTYFLIGITVIALLGLIGSLVYMYLRTNTLVTQIDSYKGEVNFERGQKEKIRKVWEDQAVQNDKLILAQENYLSQVENLQTELKRNFRFINGTIELLPTASEKRLNDNTSQVLLEKQTLEDAIKKNAELKDANKQKIDSIYLESNQDQANRANPNGIRN